VGPPVGPDGSTLRAAFWPHLRTDAFPFRYEVFILFIFILFI
jgi:hypothetical protein